MWVGIEGKFLRLLPKLTNYRAIKRNLSVGFSVKKTHTGSGFLLSLLLVGCVSSPEFILDGQEQFNNAALLGNWVCASETDLSKNNTELVMINSWQEMLDEEGSYFSVGTAEFKLNGKSAGTIQIIIDGEWIANEEHLITRGKLAKVFAHPASSEPVVKLADSRNFFKTR